MNAIDQAALALSTVVSAGEPLTVATISEYRSGWVFDVTSRAGRAQHDDRAGEHSDRSVFVRRHPIDQDRHELIDRDTQRDVYGPLLGHVNLMPSASPAHQARDLDQMAMTSSGSDAPDGADSVYRRDPFSELVRAHTAFDEGGNAPEVFSIVEFTTHWQINFAPAAKDPLKVPRCRGNVHNTSPPRGTVLLHPDSHRHTMSDSLSEGPTALESKNPGVRRGPSGRECTLHEVNTDDEGLCSAYYLEFVDPQPTYEELAGAIAEAFNWPGDYTESQLADGQIGDLDQEAQQFFMRYLNSCLNFVEYTEKPAPTWRSTRGSTYYVNSERRHGSMPATLLESLRSATRGQVLGHGSLGVTILYEIEGVYSLGYWESFA